MSVVSQIRDQTEVLENNLIKWTFTKAILSAPSVIVIEGFDLLCNGKATKRATSQGFHSSESDIK